MISVIVPTYRESGNVTELVTRVSASLVAANLDYEILIVDDNSPDGTADLVRELGKTYPVRVHVRTENRGLSPSVIDGFKLANGDICVVMDADLSHPPEKIPDMVRPLLEGRCDITVGSRYVRGGGCDEWPLIRQIISRGAGMLAKGLTNLSDPTSGFMALNKKILSDVQLNPLGWKIVLEVVARTGAKVEEVPFVFADRHSGESKLGIGVQFQYLAHLFRLYFHKLLKRQGAR